MIELIDKKWKVDQNPINILEESCLRIYVDQPLDRLAWDPWEVFWKDPSSNGKLSQFFEYSARLGRSISREKREQVALNHWDVHKVPNEFRECFWKELWCRKQMKKFTAF